MKSLVLRRMGRLLVWADDSVGCRVSGRACTEVPSSARLESVQLWVTLGCGGGWRERHHHSPVPVAAWAPTSATHTVAAYSLS